MGRRIIVSGGAGFIGSNLIRMWLKEHPDDVVLNLDHMGHAADGRNILELGPRHSHIAVDVRSMDQVRHAVHRFEPHGVVNLATPYHFEEFPPVSREFYETNVLGTFNLLESCRDVWGGKKNRRFLQTSTYEVFGNLAPHEEPFEETSQKNPANAYAFSKSTADQMVITHNQAYGMDTVVTVGSTTYGPGQRREHLIPFIVSSAFKGLQAHVPDASSIRDWIFVEDHCWGIMQAFELGRPGAVYCFSAHSEATQGEVANLVCATFDRLVSKYLNADVVRSKVPCETFVQLSDQVHPDRRSLSADRVFEEFGWEPEMPLEVGIETTVQWYINRLLYEESLS